MANLLALTELDLTNNKLKNIDKSLLNLNNLLKLELATNPLQQPPIEIANRGIKAIREYFRQLEEEGPDYIYEAKLLIVGEAGAGKTTLAKKIKNPEYVLQKDEATTKGIDLLKWKFTLDNGKEFTVNIWDFGGQEIYHATHQFFLTKRSLYTLVADTRKEDTDFYYWLNIVELLSDKSPLLIIKNERQDRQREIDERALRGQFTNLKEILATNLQTNRGLVEIITNIQHYIQNLPHIGQVLPKTWVKVRESLENDPRNYISFEEYLDICEVNGFTQLKDKLQLSGYLHDLGVCLHFQDEEDSLLYRTVILKPEWVTDAVYKVLDNQQVINQEGHFTRNDLKEIWHEEKYASRRGELLELMKKFQLCYEIPSSKDTFIAPQLLSDNQPEYDWDESNNLILRYSYLDFMPQGIITRFIVVMHQYIDRQQYVWKSGVILNKDNTKAEVIEYYGKREIKIRIAGKYKRELLTNVTYELDKIHDSYNRLNYQKLIPCNCPACKNSQNPYAYELNKLLERIANNKLIIECGNPPYHEVQVLSLIDHAIDIKQLISKQLISQNKQDTNKLVHFQGDIQQLGFQLLEKGGTLGDSSQIQSIKLAQRKEIIELNSQDDVELAKKNPNIVQLYREAHRCEEQKEFTEAIRYYEKLIDINEYYLKAWEGLERIYRSLGENEKQDSAQRQIKLIRYIIDFETNAEQKITLQQLKLTNLDFFGNTKWTFQPQINILLGKNGYGKSHLLRLIISLLQKDDNISLQFFGNKLQNASIQLSLERNKTKQIIERSKTVFKKSIGKVPILAIPDVRYIDQSKITISPPSDGKSNLRELGAEDFLSQQSFEATIQNFLYELCIMFMYQGRSFDLPIFQMLHKVVGELTDEAFEFREIKPIGNARFEINVITDGNNDRLLPIQKASQGTLAVLSMFGLIYYYLKSVFPDTPVKELLSKPAIVFIDEVDAHLHPSWQRKIIRLLRKNFPNVQFVVTAHSPLVVAGCLNSEVAVLRKGEDGFVVEEFPEDFIGETTENLYRKLFEIEDIDENYLYYATRISANIDNSERINVLESKETLTDEEEMELEMLYEDDYYISRVAQKIEEKKAEDYELKTAELEAEIRELKYQLELQQNKKN